MKVYVVWYDNGEEYEDNYQDISKIFSTKEAAVKYLEDSGKQLKNDWYEEAWGLPEFVCSMGDIYCYDCPLYDEKLEEETGYCCVEKRERFDCYYCKYEQWTIREFELNH